MAAVYAAREGPPSVDLPTQYAPQLAALRTACEAHQGSTHQKTHALAVELLNDWEAIFQVLSHPALPLTNNDAERALRHWVILRQLSSGTRTPVGSRVVALLASVIDTCRQRGHARGAISNAPSPTARRRPRTEGENGTWNCTHIANAHTRPRIEATCRALGYEPPVICTPLELTED